MVNKLQTWQDWKFGVLIHWGAYSQWGIVESWSLCPEDEGWCERRGAYAKTSEQLSPLLTKGVGAGDVVMIKGSFGSRMAPLVEALQRHFQAPSKAAQA